MIIRLPDGQTPQIHASGETIEEILTRIGVEPMEFLIARNDEIIPEDTIPAEDDIIHLIRISHGG
jgi:sulfur carrier protein ThiS